MVREALARAQYDAGRYREAIDALRQADRLYTAVNGESKPEDLSFLAMAYQKLQRPQEATRAYARAQEAHRRLKLGPENERVWKEYLAEADDVLGKRP